MDIRNEDRVTLGEKLTLLRKRPHEAPVTEKLNCIILKSSHSFLIELHQSSMMLESL